jgi:hypothetical protein
MIKLYKILLWILERLHIPFYIVAVLFEWLDMKLDRLEWFLYKKAVLDPIEDKLIKPQKMATYKGGEK